jgi:molybdopterin synthase catalytic subunit
MDVGAAAAAASPAAAAAAAAAPAAAAAASVGGGIDGVGAWDGPPLVPSALAGCGPAGGHRWEGGDADTWLLLTHEPLDVTACSDFVTLDATGATCLFLGTTRDSFAGRVVGRLEYEAYGPMALKVLAAICADARSRWALPRIAVLHRLGAVPVRETRCVRADAARGVYFAARCSQRPGGAAGVTGLPLSCAAGFFFFCFGQRGHRGVQRTSAGQPACAAVLDRHPEGTRAHLEEGVVR